MKKDVLTIREAVARAKEEGIAISEYAMRSMVKEERFPVRMVGRKILVYYPIFLAYITCRDVEYPAGEGSGGPACRIRKVG